MGDVFAIVSKAVFEKEARVGGKAVGLGDVWPVARYNGTGKVFETQLGAGGRIFMVTVRPPDEKLWLLAILESPTAEGKAWVGAPNRVKVTDITPLRKTIKFESGKGMSQDKGALGMSLQTPRALGPGDAKQILAALGGTGANAPAAGTPPPSSEAPVRSAPGKRAAPPGAAAPRDPRVAGLLSAIRSEPSDDTSRLVLADLYEDTGDLERARFIRSQVERATLPRWDPRVPVMDLEERAIQLDREAAWRAELPKFDGVSYGGFERGLIARIAFDDAALVPQHIEAAMAACPFTGLMIRWPRLGARPKLGPVEGLRALTVVGTLLQNDDLAWLAASPVLSTLEELNLEHSHLDDTALGILLDSPHLGRLRRLRLPFHQLGSEGLGRLAQATLPELVELDLSVETQDRVGSGGRDGPIIDADGIIALCAWPGLAKLECLDLTGNQIGATGLGALLASKNAKRLKTLRIRSVSDFDWENETRPDVLGAFAQARADLRLEELDIGENELTPKAVTALVRSPALAELRILSFDFHQADRQLPKLLEAPWLDAVHVLSLNEGSLPAVKTVLERAPPSLHTLSLMSGFPWSELKGIVNTLASAPPQKALRSINLRGCNIDDKALKRLGTVTTLPSLIALELGANGDSGYSDEDPPFSAEAAKAFLKSPLGQQLRSVVVGIDGLDRLPPPPDFTLSDGDDDDDDDDDEDEDEDDDA